MSFGTNLLPDEGNLFSTVLIDPVLSSANAASFNIVNPANLQAFINLVNTSGSSNILSSPKISVIVREVGEIVVGQNVPFITGFQESRDNGDPVNEIERQDVGVKLTVEPLIFPNGTIQLTVYQEISDVTNSTFASDIITNQRSISSKLVVRDGESVYLGGLKSETTQVSESRVPVLSRIPLLGRLFRSSEQKDVTRVLAVVLTVRVV